MTDKLPFNSSSSVEIVGMGIISSIGDNIAEFTKSLYDGRCGIKQLNQIATPEVSVKIGAVIENFCFEKSLNQFSGFPEQLINKAFSIARRSPFAIQTSVISALQAWHLAQLSSDQIRPERIGIIIAGHNTTNHYQYQLHSGFETDPEYLSPRYALQSLDSDQLGIISEIFNIQGEGFVVGGASASGNIAVIQANRLIQSGVVDACVVIGVVADLSPVDIQAFHNIGAMGGKQFHDQAEIACRPFDTRHEGFIYGQASASLVLENADSAANRKVPKLAKILGGSIHLSANSSSQPSQKAEASVMQSALLQSGLTIDQIDYLNAHGSSSPLGDNIEIQAIEQVFGHHFPKLWINATKGLTGHCLHAAGIVEIIASIIQIQLSFIHPNINLETPNNTTAKFSGKTAIDQPIDTAITNAFGFGGINTSIVLQNSN